MRVAMKIDPPRRNRIQNLASVLGLYKNTLRAANGKGRWVHTFLCERMPEMEVGRAHILGKSLMVELFFINIKQCSTINVLEQGDLADDANIPVMLDCAAILNVLVANEHHTANCHARLAQCGKRQKRVIDRPKRRACGDDDGKTDAQHEIAHQVAFVK